MKDYKKLGKIGEFVVYYDTVDKKYFGERIGFKNEIINADSLEELKHRALNYGDELADYFSNIIKGSRIRD